MLQHKMLWSDLILCCLDFIAIYKFELTKLGKLKQQKPEILLKKKKIMDLIMKVNSIDGSLSFCPRWSYFLLL